MRKIFIITILFVTTVIFGNFALAENNLAKKLSGRILLQVEQKGEAWYINPLDQKRYFLGRPDDAFLLMKKLGIGISNNDLNKIPANPEFTKNNSGKIFLQTEKNGEAWYVDPVSQNKYFLGRPDDAFQIMKKMGLGILNKNINQIPIGHLNTTPPITNNSDNSNYQTNSADSTISNAASAIRANNKSEATKYFIPEMKKAIEYTMDFLDADGRLTLGNILSGSKLSDSSDTKKTYTNEVYFSLGGYKVPLKFYVEKQINGEWLLTNL